MKIQTAMAMVVAAAMTSAPALSPASAQDGAEFYKGKSLTMVIGYPPGGGFDQSARLVMRHMSNHIPGSPSIVPRNMPGAGSLIAANYMFNVAPKDGTHFGLIGGSVPFGPLWSREGVEFEPTQFNWIGSLDRWTGIALVWHAAPVQTLDDVMKTEITVGATGAGDVTAIYPRVLNALLGTQFRIATGYRGSNDLNLAIERGEVHGRLGWCWDCVAAVKPDWIEQNQVRVLVQLGMTKDDAPGLENVPHVFDLAKSDEDRQIMRLVFGSQAMARPFVAPPGVPADRLSILREAFENTLKDEAFMAEADKLRVPVNLTRWSDMEKIIADVYATPKPVIERAAAIVTGK